MGCLRLAAIVADRRAKKNREDTRHNGHETNYSQPSERERGPGRASTPHSHTTLRITVGYTAHFLHAAGEKEVKRRMWTSAALMREGRHPPVWRPTPGRRAGGTGAGGGPPACRTCRASCSTFGQTTRRSPGGALYQCSRTLVCTVF